jgi:hypothetical protein
MITTFFLQHSRSVVLLDLYCVVRLGGWLELSVSRVEQRPLGDCRVLSNARSAITGQQRSNR